MRDYDESYEWWAEIRLMAQEQAKYHVKEWVEKNVNNPDALQYLFETEGLDPFGLATIMLEHTTEEARIKELLNEYEKNIEEFLISSDEFHKKIEAMRRGHDL
jgi:hypothetical protein